MVNTSGVMVNANGVGNQTEISSREVEMVAVGKTLDANKYATKKTIAQGMLDIALLTANASQLKYVLQLGHRHEFYHIMVSLIASSIVLQDDPTSREEDFAQRNPKLLAELHINRIISKVVIMVIRNNVIPVWSVLTPSSTAVAETTNSYLRGISVKISEKYRPLRRPTLPPGLCHFEPPSHLFCDDIELLDESSALKLVESIRNLRTQELVRRKQRIAALEEQNIDEKEIEEITSGLPLNSRTNSIPSQNVINLHPSNGQLLPHTQTSMEVLTPIQSSTVEIKKKENMSVINLAEFESYSTNPFEEMELKTLNDKEELAMLLQPNSQSSYRLPYQNYNPSTMAAWPEQRHQLPLGQYQSSWIPNENTVFGADKISFGNMCTPMQSNDRTVSHTNLRQAKSVPDLSDTSFGTGGIPINHLPFAGALDKRLSSRTPPPRLTLDSIKRPMPMPSMTHSLPFEKNLTAVERCLVQQLHDMGFVRETAARAIARLGANEKDVVDQLLLIQKLEEAGHSIQRIESALDVLKPCTELPEQIEHHLRLVDQLSALGFDHRKISSALVAACHNRDKALDILLLK
ncbi:ubiquitin-associated protein 1-like [Daphnia carinata]|uniref:ubiquitin-associated protein 1-like n=1 Tax=Daphnia carinata TaxID=120202 RepID=UPI00257D8CFA|nr:ubiquitin-associated protein 1-like [Daphnia carinata]